MAIRFKKRYFDNLHYLLINSGMRDEERIFTAAMKTVFEKHGKHTLFKNKKKIAEFVTDAEPIVKRFFLVRKDS